LRIAAWISTSNGIFIEVSKTRLKRFSTEGSKVGQRPCRLDENCAENTFATSCDVVAMELSARFSLGGEAQWEGTSLFLKSLIASQGDLPYVCPEEPSLITLHLSIIHFDFSFLTCS
jgi:hypothetical protein